jgi:hypothetical protein
MSQKTMDDTTAAASATPVTALKLRMRYPQK